jgi:predicted transcriptional regulator
MEDDRMARKKADIIGEILEANRNPQARTVKVEVARIEQHAGLRLVAVLAEIMADGLFWKLEKNKCGKNYALTVVGHMKRDVTISPHYLEYLLSLAIVYEDIDNYVRYAGKYGMNEYDRLNDQFGSDAKIKDYIQAEKKKAGRQKVSRAVTNMAEEAMAAGL